MHIAWTALLLLIPLTACGGLRAGGELSGVPDSTVGDWRQPTGTVSTGGEIRLNRERGL